VQHQVRHHCLAEGNGLATAVEEVQACLIQLMSHVATPSFLDEEEVRVFVYVCVIACVRDCVSVRVFVIV
jgi:hypothetical protein